MPSKTDASGRFRYWRFLFFLAASVLVINLLVAVVSVSRMKSNYDEMSRVMKMAMAVRAAYSAIQSVEISERNYLLGRDQARTVYRESVSELIAQMRNMELIETGPRTRLLVSNLNDLLLQRLNNESIVRDDPAPGDAPTFDENWNSEEATELLLEIRASVEAIESTYRNLMVAKGADIERAQSGVLLAIAVVTGLGVASMILIYRVVQQTLAEQATWEEQQLRYKEDLERRVSQRTEDLQRYSIELKRSNQELEDFAFVASHDLQEPLRKIMAFSDRLEKKHASDLGEGVDYLYRMHAAAERMSRLISDLLEFSRVTTHPGKFGKLSLDTVLTEVLDDLHEVITSTNAHVSSDTLPEIEADNTQMHQLLQNLIGNAIKFVDKGSHPQIHIASRMLDGESEAASQLDKRRVEIQVIDNGIGFEDAYSDRIFKPFQRLHSQSEYTGTGIGLAVCKRIVERHGGTIAVESQPGSGSVFTINLPVTQVLTENVRSLSHIEAELGQEVI